MEEQRRRIMPWKDKPALKLENLFVTHGSKKVYKKNEIFKKVNESNEYLFYLKEGFCYNFTTSDNGDVNIIRLLAPGSLFGEVTSVIEMGGSLTSTRAIAESCVYSLKYTALLDLIVGDKELIHAVIETYAWRVGAYNYVIYAKNTFSNEQKVAQLFISMYDESNDDAFFNLPYYFSHQQIGEFVGLARETVSRVLSRWKEQGIIVSGKNSISIMPKELIEILRHPVK